MATSMDDCFLASHRINMPIQHGHCAGLGLAMHVLLDLAVPSRSAPSLVLRQGSPSPSSMMLTANQCRWTAPSTSACPVSGTAVSAAAVGARPEGSIHCSHRHVK